MPFDLRQVGVALGPSSADPLRRHSGGYTPAPFAADDPQYRVPTEARHRGAGLFPLEIDLEQTNNQDRSRLESEDHHVSCQTNCAEHHQGHNQALPRPRMPEVEGLSSETTPVREAVLPPLLKPLRPSLRRHDASRSQDDQPAIISFDCGDEQPPQNPFT